MQHVKTTHVGSLPRPSGLTDLLTARDRGEQVDGIDERVSDAVVEMVRRQRDAGLSIVNDGEAGKVTYATYVTSRLNGFEGVSEQPRLRPLGWEEFPDFFTRIPLVELECPSCTSPISHRDLTGVNTDIGNLKRALGGSGGDDDDAFMTAASPGVIAIFLPNRHYATHEEYIWALAEAMKPEYDAIAAAGILLQLDCPDLTTPDLDMLAMHISAINHATRDIAPERMRMHVCWGNYEGPHNHDVPLSDIIETVLTARPAALLFEGANPRHAHEWRVFQDVSLPDEKVLIPGVIDSTTNYIEHPRLIADRILSYASLVGPERVIAGTDCGFATAAHYLLVDPAITWAKLRALSDGAALASHELAHATRA